MLAPRSRASAPRRARYRPPDRAQKRPPRTARCRASRSPQHRADRRVRPARNSFVLGVTAGANDGLTRDVDVAHAPRSAAKDRAVERGFLRVAREHQPVGAKSGGQARRRAALAIARRLARRRGRALRRVRRRSRPRRPKRDGARVPSAANIPANAIPRQRRVRRGYPNRARSGRAPPRRRPPGRFHLRDSLRSWDTRPPRLGPQPGASVRPVWRASRERATNAGQVRIHVPTTRPACGRAR